MKADGKRVNRRSLLGSVGAGAALCTIVPSSVRGGAGKTAPSDKLNVAVVGTGGRGSYLATSALRLGQNLIALCDVDPAQLAKARKSLASARGGAAAAKQAKGYGTCKYAEGPDLVGKRIVLVEDVVSSGGEIIARAEMLRADGVDVDTAICVIDRQTGGAEALRQQGIELRAALTMAQIDSA